MKDVYFLDKKAFKYAVVQTIPIMLGFLFIGIAFGLVMTESGYGFIWAVAMPVIIYSGSLQFALIPLIMAKADLFTIAVMSLSMCSRQMFYGLSLIERFKRMGRKSLFMMFALSDETYSVLCSEVPDDIDRQKFDFYVALLDYLYWIAGCALGSLFGQLIPFNTTGIDFAMTALFVVICVEQWKGSKNHAPAITGVICGIISLVALGPSSFILPALAASVAILLVFRKKFEEVDE